LAVPLEDIVDGPLVVKPEYVRLVDRPFGVAARADGREVEDRPWSVEGVTSIAARLVGWMAHSTAADRWAARARGHT